MPPLLQIASPCPPTSAHSVSIQRIGRPVVKTTGTPRSSSAVSTARVRSVTVPSVCSRVPSRSVRRGRRARLSHRRDRAQRPRHHELAVLVGAAELGEAALGEHPDARRVVGQDGGPDAYAVRVGQRQQRADRLGGDAATAGVGDQAVADLGLGHVVGGTAAGGPKKPIEPKTSPSKVRVMCRGPHGSSPFDHRRGVAVVLARVVGVPARDRDRRPASARPRRR